MDGFNKHRHASNPKEKELHDKFKKDFIEGDRCSVDTINRLVFGHPENSIEPNDYLTNRERQIVLSTIQWLGSPVGQGFLESCELKAKETTPRFSKIENGSDGGIFDWILEDERNACDSTRNSTMIRKLVERYNDLVDFINIIKV